MFCLTIWLFSLGLFLPESTSAQNFNIQTFTTRDGLSHNEVRGVALDSLGFLWIATWDGLSRYDGHSFRNYFHNPDDSLTLPYFSIQDVQVDGGGNLWLITDVGTVTRYDRDKDIFKTTGITKDSLPERFINISIDESGYMWLLDSDRIFRYDFIKNIFERYDLCDRDGSVSEMLSAGVTYSVSTKEDNKVWIVFSEILEFGKSSDNKLILKNEYRISESDQLDDIDFGFSSWYRIYHSESGRKWIFSNVGLFLLDEETGIFREFRDPFPGSEFRGRGCLFWSWYNGGLYIYSMNEARLSHIPDNYCQLLRGVFSQNKDLVWFSSHSVTGAALGLTRVVFTPDYFKDYPLPGEENDVRAVYAVARDKENSIWVGMRGNDPLIRITPESETLKVRIPDNFGWTDAGAIRSISATDEGVWIGFFRKLLIFYNSGSGKFTRYNPDAHWYRPLAVDNNGDLYLDGGQNHRKLIRFCPGLEMITDSIFYSSKSPIYKIVIDPGGNVWCGMNGSLVMKYDPASQKVESFILSKGNYNVEDICIGEKGELWFALLGGGVCNFEPVTGRKIFYTTSGGLANNMTYCLLKDNSGNIWVSTNTGISRINPETGKIRSFGRNEGLNIIEFNSGASYACNDGEFLMGGMGGLVGFYPDEINKAGSESGDQKVIVTEVRVSGQEMHFKQTPGTSDTIIFNKGDNNFKVYFSSSDFVNSTNTLYRYKLSNINGDWVEADSRNRNISYANLKPGWYNFQLQATDRNGSWTASREIRIKFPPYFYQTLFFKVTVTLFLLFLVSGMILIYIRQLKQRESQKQDALRLQSLRGQMNPHFIFNSLNSINYFISNNDKLSANRYIADFSKLIRSILHNLSHDYVTLEKEIESVEDYLKIEHLRFGDKFDYQVIVDSTIGHENVKVSPGLVQPFIENAIWHGVRGLEIRKGMIEVWFGYRYGQLTCIVKDDGIGRKKAEMLRSGNDQKKSKGISIGQERLRIINGLQKSHYQIFIADLHPDRTETGTLVEIDIPVFRE